MENTILGFGAMRLPQTDANNPASVKMEETQQMVDYYMEHGFDYFDTSYAYHGETSEDVLKKTLVERYPRESYRIADKIPTWLLTHEKDNERLVDVMLERLGIEYFDVLLIHNINASFINLAESANSFEYIKKAKDEGKALKVGISYHDKADLLDEVLDKYSDIIDVVQLQINFMDWLDGRVQSKKCHEVCVKYGVEVIVMEPVKGGSLVNVSDNVKKAFKDYSDKSIVDWSLRFAASHENISVVLSGMSSLEQMKENCETFKDFEEITHDDYRFLMKMAREIKKTLAIDCSYCGYCVKECEMGIPIPDLFNLYNGEKLHSLQANYGNYGTITAANAPASACTQCGTCIDFCTQKLDIPELLKDVANLFENV
ncbi:aldo/keto reductase [Methanobrevibacter sp.]|uniref:aldo/keto reductase n=1 Tax=Methanobrevibacter sp. TaxID=66852 RepID=UPI00388EF620